MRTCRRKRSGTGLPIFIVAAAVVGSSATRVSGGPLDDSHVADTGFSGPTTGDLTAVYWNPAGLGLLQGPQLMLGGAIAATSVSVNRTSIDPQTGTNPGSLAFPTATGSALAQPLRWPPGPQSFMAVGIGIGHRFGIAVALYSPFSTRLTMQPSADGQEPTRYHLVSMELDHIALTPAIAIHASDSIQLGVATGFLFPTAHLVFDQDAALLDPSLAAGVENPAAAARYNMATQGLLAPSYLITAGGDYRRGRLALGFAYTSAPLGTGGAVTLPLENVQITLPPALADQTLCVNRAGNCVVGQMTYHLPSIYTLGASWQVARYWSLTGIARWLRYGGSDNITIVLSGPAAQPMLGTVLPNQMVLYQGFVDSFDLRARLAYATKDFRVGGTFRVETSAVPPANVNAAAIDGTKLEPSLAADVHIWRQTRLGVSYAFLWMLPVATGASVFNPAAVAACNAAGGDLTNPACQERMNGQAQPSAAGTYHLWRQTLSVYTTIGL